MQGSSFELRDKYNVTKLLLQVFQLFTRFLTTKTNKNELKYKKDKRHINFNIF